MQGRQGRANEVRALWGVWLRGGGGDGNGMGHCKSNAREGEALVHGIAERGPGMHDATAALSSPLTSPPTRPGAKYPHDLCPVSHMAPAPSRSPQVPLEVRNGMVKLAMDSQFLQALTRLAAAVGEAEVREAQRRCAQLSSLRSARALRSATSDAKPLSTRLMIEGNCIGLLTTFVGVAMDL